MREQFLFTGGLQRGQAQQRSVIAEFTKKGSLTKGLLPQAADSGDSQQRLTALCIGPSHFCSGQFEQWLKKCDLRIADSKLRGMDSDRQPARACGSIISKERPLAALVEFSRARERQRAGWDGQAALQKTLNARVH